MENPSNLDAQSQLVETLIARLDQYSQTRLEILRLKALSKTAGIVGMLSAHLAVVLFLLLFLLILNVAIGLCIGEAMGHYSYGFFIVAGFDALVGLILYLTRKKLIEKPISETILSQIID